MKKQKVNKYLFLSLLFAGVALMSFPGTVSAVDSVLVIGDSIAVGVSESLRNVTKVSAVVGASSGTIAGYDGSGSFTHMVISAGSNDPTSSSLAANLRRIRAKQPNAKVVWILPYNAAAKATVRSVASSDATVDLSSFPAAADGVHPRSYSQVAAAVQTALGAAAGGATTGGATTTGTGGPAYNSVAGAPVEAGLVRCGLSGDDPRTSEIDESKPCTACHLLFTANVIIEWIRNVMTVIAIAVIFGMGILYIVSAGNDKMIGIAKGGIKAALIGVAWILVAWVVVSTVIRIMGASNFFTQVGFQQTGAFSFSCDIDSAAGTATSTNFGSGANSGGGTGGTGGGTTSGGGTCTVPASGACSPATLAGTCFGGSNVDSWAKICNFESGGGRTDIKSGTDLCVNYGNKSFSGGLWQINVLDSGASLDPQRCSNLGNKGSQCVNRLRNGACGGWNCSIRSMADFDYCMGLAMNPTLNTRAACSLSGNGHVTTPWPNTRRFCSIPTRI